MNVFNGQTNQQNGQYQVPGGYQWNNAQTPQQPYIQSYQQQPQPVVPNWNRPAMPMGSAVSTYPSLPGRIVTNPQEIRANEVMMDGTPSLFPLNDYSCIYAKVWDANGSIQTVRFVPEKQEQPQQGSSNFDLVMERLDNIEKMIQSQSNRKQYYNNQKKEADNNGN